MFSISAITTRHTQKMDPTKHSGEKEEEEEFNQDGEWHGCFFFPEDMQGAQALEDDDIGWEQANKNAQWWEDPDPFMP